MPCRLNLWTRGRSAEDSLTLCQFGDRVRDAKKRDQYKQYQDYVSHCGTPHVNLTETKGRRIRRSNAYASIFAYGKGKGAGYRDVGEVIAQAEALQRKRISRRPPASKACGGLKFKQTYALPSPDSRRRKRRKFWTQRGAPVLRQAVFAAKPQGNRRGKGY